MKSDARAGIYGVYLGVGGNIIGPPSNSKEKMTDITKLSKKYKFDSKQFDTSKSNYYTFCNNIDNPSFSVEKSENAFKTLCENFVQILDIAASEVNLKESATIYSPKKLTRPTHVAIETEITDINITFGLFRDFYLATPIKNPKSIKFMKDEFWGLLFELSVLGKFGFKEAEQSDKKMRQKHPQLFNKTGNYYKLLRNYFLFEVDYGHIRNLGSISVSWDNSTTFDKLIPKICDTFKIMYQLNFLLWRHENKNVKF